MNGFCLVGCKRGQHKSSHTPRSLAVSASSPLSNFPQQTVHSPNTDFSFNASSEAAQNARPTVLYDRSSIPATRKRFSLSLHVHTASGTHLALYPMGSEIVSPGIRRPERKADDSLPPSVKIKKKWSYISSTPHTSSWCGAQEVPRENLTGCRSLNTNAAGTTRK